MYTHTYVMCDMRLAMVGGGDGAGQQRVCSTHTSLGLAFTAGDQGKHMQGRRGGKVFQ
jgi:hypothetical protein